MKPNFNFVKVKEYKVNNNIWLVYNFRDNGLWLVETIISVNRKLWVAPISAAEIVLSLRELDNIQLIVFIDIDVVKHIFKKYI